MNVTENRIKIVFILYDNSYRKEVVNLLESLALVFHLSVDTEKMLYTAVDFRMNISLIHDVLNFHNDIGNVFLTLLFGENHLVYEVLISFGLKIFKR